MNKNRGNGYTITEVLIVIGISSAMFIIAVVAFNGRQQQVQFDQSVRDFESQIIDIINDVATGYYPADENVGCRILPTVASPPQIIPPTEDGSNEDNLLGTNPQCLYVGKVLHFRDPSFNEEFSDYRIINLVGKRFISSEDFDIADEVSEVIPQAVSFVEVIDRLTYGVRVVKIVQPNPNPPVLPVGPEGSNSPRDHDLVVLLANFEGGSLVGANTQAQNVKIAGINTIEPYGRSKEDAIDTINNLTDTDKTQNDGYADFKSRNGVIFCLDDGDGRVASLSIGVSGTQTTNLRIGTNNIAEECLDNDD